ncbi:MAG: DegT/DnrJ/EryC1/StrS family aminotransferase [Sulfolobales archaeon]
MGRKWPKPDPVGESLLLASYRSGRWGRFDGGGFVDKFEKDFARYHDAEYGVAVMNATAGLMMAYMALDLEPGDLFVVPAYTFIATASAGVAIGLKPVFVDIDFDTLTIDINSLAEAIERDRDNKIKLVVPVHFAGNPSDMDRVIKLARSHNAYVVEDAAQAQGSIYRGRKVGAIGDIGVFSFQSSKLMTAGEGGIALTNDKELYERMWSIMHAGRDPRGRWYEHIRIGLNFRMLEFQAAVLLPQLWNLDDTLRRIRENAKIVYEELSSCEALYIHRYPDHIKTNYYFIPISIEEKFIGRLSKEKIVSRMREKGYTLVEGYIKPLNKQAAFAEKRWRLPYEEYLKQSLPNTERACRSTMWIPHPEMLESEEYVSRYAKELKNVVREYLG